MRRSIVTGCWQGCWAYTNVETKAGSHSFDVLRSRSMQSEETKIDGSIMLCASSGAGLWAHRTRSHRFIRRSEITPLERRHVWREQIHASSSSRGGLGVRQRGQLHRVDKAIERYAGPHWQHAAADQATWAAAAAGYSRNRRVGKPTRSRTEADAAEEAQIWRALKRAGR